MDTMKLLLGTIIALLLAALVMSWNGMQQGVKNTSTEETQRLGKQIEALKAEQDRLALERQLLQQNTALAVAPPIAPPVDTGALKQQVDENSQKLAQLAEEKAKAERDAKVANDENLLLSGRKMEEQNTLMREARLISQALLVGKITEYIEDAQTGGFVTLQILMPEQVQQNSIVAIRRKTGILGQLKVSEVSPEGGVANPLPGFGPVQPKVGDELILPPQY